MGRIGLGELDGVLNQTLGRLEMPIGDPSLLPLLALAPKLRSQVSLLLDGTGNDALFGILPARHDALLLQLRSLPGCGWAARRLRSSRVAERKPWIRRLARPRDRFFLSWDGLIWDGASSLRRQTEAAWDESLATVSRRNRIIEKTQTIGIWEAGGPYARSQLFASACEAPVTYPWLGPRLSQALLRLARDELFGATQNKRVLRRWLEQHAPPYIATKPKGMFIVPIGSLLNRRRELLHSWYENPSKTLLAEAGIPAPLVREALGAWLRGRRCLDTSIYGLVVLEAWLSCHLG